MKSTKKSLEGKHEGVEPLVWLALSGLLIAVGIALIDLVGVDRIKKLSAQDWAAWVQAVGSIAAIAWASAMGRRQITAARELEIARRKSDQVERLFGVLGICQAIERCASDLISLLEEKYDADRDYDETLLRLVDYAEILGTVDALTLPTRFLMHKIRVLSSKSISAAALWKTARRTRQARNESNKEMREAAGLAMYSVLYAARSTITICKFALNQLAPHVLDEGYWDSKIQAYWE